MLDILGVACDEIKKALEGLLAPDETVERRATAEVREVYHLSRKGGVVLVFGLSTGALAIVRYKSN